MLALLSCLSCSAVDPQGLNDTRPDAEVLIDSKLTAIPKCEEFDSQCYLSDYQVCAQANCFATKSLLRTGEPLPTCTHVVNGQTVLLVPDCESCSNSTKD